MELISTIGTAVTIIKNLRDLTKNDTVDRNEILRLSGDLAESLLSVQQLALASQQRETKLVDSKRELEEELRNIKSWREQLSEYRLENIVPGSAVYVHLPTRQDPQVAHWLCQPCADDGRKSVLQVNPGNAHLFSCPRCSALVRVGARRPGGPIGKPTVRA